MGSTVTHFVSEPQMFFLTKTATNPSINSKIFDLPSVSQIWTRLSWNAVFWVKSLTTFC